MKILTFTPVWQRPEVFKIALAGIERLMNYAPERFQITPFFMVSETWAAKLLDKKGYMYTFTENNPLGNKKNEGLTCALKHYEFDYLLEIGSDDLVTNKYMDLCHPLLKAGTMQMVGSDVYFIDILTGKRAYFNTSKIFGCGRFIHNEAIKKALTLGPFWNPEAVRGMDTYSWRQLLKVDISFTKIELFEPCLLDIKSGTNINTIDIFPPLHMPAAELLAYFPEGESISQLIGE